MIAEAAQPNAGDPAPGFTATAVGGKYGTGQVVRLEDFRGRPVVLYFFPTAHTPGSKAQAWGLGDAWSKFDGPAEIFGVSIDSTASHEKFIAKYDLPFPLLSDHEKKIANAYGVWVEKSMYGRKYMGTARTTFIIDACGRIAKILSQVKPAEHVAELRTPLGNAK